jgi:hypothetical protein
MPFNSISHGKLPAALVMILVAGALSASVAGAATIHACVRPKSGATRVVGAKAKCHHGEQKLSWSSEGPRGPAGSGGAQGAPGSAGANGLNGAGPLFSAVSSKQPHVSPEGTVLVSKVLPPGSYMIWAKTDVFETSTKAEVENVTCALLSHPGTTETEEPTVLDESISELELGMRGGGGFGAADTIPLQGAFATSVTSTVLMECTLEGGAKATVTSLIAQLQALGVTSIG